MVGDLIVSATSGTTTGGVVRREDNDVYLN